MQKRGLGNITMCLQFAGIGCVGDMVKIFKNAPGKICGRQTALKF